MNILLTGSSGFLGKEILKVLNSQNTVFELNRNKGDYQIDLSTSEATFNSNFDLIIHSAGKAHSLPKTEEDNLSFYNVNVQGTKNLLTGLEKNGIPERFLFISSVSVYGLEQGELIDEKHPLNAKDSFGQNKIQAESIILEWCKKNNVLCTILRLPLVVGLNPPGNLGAMIKGINKGYYFNIAGGNSKKSMVLSEDVAKFILKAADVGGIYNLTDGYHPTFSELSILISNQLGKRKPMNMPLWVANIIAKIGDFLGSKSPVNSKKILKLNATLTFDDSKAREAFGWSPKKVIDGFRV